MNAQEIPGFAPTWIGMTIIGIVVAALIILLIRALTNRSATQLVWTLAGAFLIVLSLGIFSFRVSHQETPVHVGSNDYGGSGHGRRGRDDHGTPLPALATPPIKLSSELSASNEHSHEDTDAAAGKSENKPAWLTQGTQTGNGVSQFPISSELFATVAECQKDLDRRTPTLIAEELRFLAGEQYAISFTPDEVKALTAETYTEVVPTTSQGNWYKIHRLIKVDNIAWAGIRERFQQAILEYRLKTLALSFGGLMLFIGTVYLILRRSPRVVDPTLNTFSTT